MKHKHTKTKRTCYKCLKFKPVSKFYQRKDGSFFSACIPCQKVLRNERKERKL